MNYSLSKKYQSKIYTEKFMGPNPIKLTEEMMKDNKITQNGVVMDLGSGQGVTSAFLCKEYGFTVYAADLWSNPSDNMRFFESVGLSNKEIIPVKADANDLPFADGFFDGITSSDSYNYFGRDKNYLGDKLLNKLKLGGYLYITIPGMKKDLHNNLPKELLLSWTPEQLDYLHDADYWREIFNSTSGAEIVELKEMESNEEVWTDWISCENDYAVNDRASINAGALKYLNFIKAVIKRVK